MNFTIYKRKDGRFEGRLKLEKMLTGKFKYKYVYASSYSECLIKTQSILKDIIKSNDLNNITFQDISYQWLENTKTYIKKSTYAVYLYILERHLLPNLGLKNINYINEATIRIFINDLYKKKSKNSNEILSSITVYNIIVILRMIFTFANKNFSLLNPTQNIKIFKDKQFKEFLSDKYWQMIYKSLKTDKSTTALAISIALYMGLRIGEICALQVNNINFNNNTLFIEKTVQRVNLLEDNKKTKLIISTPKTNTSRRLIPIPDILLKPLKLYCSNLAIDDFLFGIDGKVLDPRTLQYRFKRYLKKYNIPYINFHQLRHKFAGNCVENNMDIKVLSEILGHSNVNITLNYYVHPTMTFKRKQLNKVFRNCK